MPPKEKGRLPSPNSSLSVLRRPVNPRVDTLSVRAWLVLDLDDDRPPWRLFDPYAEVGVVFDSAVIEEGLQTIESALGLVVEGERDCLLSERPEGFEFVRVDVLHGLRELDLELNEGRLLLRGLVVPRHSFDDPDV